MTVFHIIVSVPAASPIINEDPPLLLSMIWKPGFNVLDEEEKTLHKAVNYFRSLYDSFSNSSISRIHVF